MQRTARALSMRVLSIANDRKVKRATARCFADSYIGEASV
jgi:hypothetical protein